MAWGRGEIAGGEGSWQGFPRGRDECRWGLRTGHSWLQGKESEPLGSGKVHFLGPKKVDKSSKHCDNPTLGNHGLGPPNLLYLSPGEPTFCGQALSPSHHRGSAVPSLDGFRDFTYMPG